MDTMMNVMANEATAIGMMGMEAAAMGTMINDTAMDFKVVGADKEYEDEIRSILMLDYEDVKDMIKVRLLPASVQADVYVSAAEYGFKDLILVPYIHNMVKMVDGFASARVSCSLLDRWGVTKDEVIKQGIENLDYKIINMGEFFGLPEMDSPMFVVSNADMVSGAASIIAAKDELERRFPEGYIVLPSSRHEVIVVSKSTGSKNELLDMVIEINATVVADYDKLSDSVYEF